MIFMQTDLPTRRPSYIGLSQRRSHARSFSQRKSYNFSTRTCFLRYLPRLKTDSKFSRLSSISLCQHFGHERRRPLVDTLKTSTIWHVYVSSSLDTNKNYSKVNKSFSKLFSSASSLFLSTKLDLVFVDEITFSKNVLRFKKRLR